MVAVAAGAAVVVPVLTTGGDKAYASWSPLPVVLSRPTDLIGVAHRVRHLLIGTGSTKEGLFSYSEGAVGRDVVDITFTTPPGASRWKPPSATAGTPCGGPRAATTSAAPRSAKRQPSTSP